MTHVFVSYKREDELRVQRLAQALEKAGLDVWWDRGLPGGESWHANIEQKLTTAGCVIVVWSEGSVDPEGGQFVRDEARVGLERGVLVPVLFDSVKRIPLGFGEVQAIDLRHWKGSPGDPFFKDLVATVRAKLEGAPVGKPKGPSARLSRRLLLGGGSSATLVLAAALALNIFGAGARLCSVPGLQPGLSDTCGSVGFGGRPNRAERMAWADRPPTSCQALRDHIARFPEGAYRREAADLLTARRVTSETRWTPATRSLPLFAPADGPPSATETAAKAAALERAKPKAEALCRGFGAGTLFRFVGAAPKADTWTCAAHVCGFDGEAVCSLEARQQEDAEVCGAAGSAR